jgi:hypothetical protein
MSFIIEQEKAILMLVERDYPEIDTLIRNY